MKTVGKLSQELIVKQQHDTHSAEEQMREQLSDYEKSVVECVDTNKKTYPGDFFVSVLTKRERLLTNVMRNYFFARYTCPTPEWDQAVYRYDRDDDAIELLWVIPSWQACEALRRDLLNLTDKERLLANYVLALDDGTLLRLAKQMNGEKQDSILLH